MLIIMLICALFIGHARKEACLDPSLKKSEYLPAGEESCASSSSSSCDSDDCDDMVRDPTLMQDKQLGFHTI